MKELSIEGKAKAYDEVQKRVEECYHDGLSMSQSPKEVLEYIFSELKESEDERIRKELIGYFTGWGDNHLFRGFKVEQILAWLEKQGEHANFRNKIQIGDKVTRNEDGMLVNLSQLKRVAKPANKVEPKFKIEEGKWYICISQFCNCIEGRNYKASLDGRIIDDYGTEYDMHNDAYRWFRPWTIQDAKDGDILCTYECDEPKIVFILKGTPKRHYALSYHCYYNIMYLHFDSDSEKGCLAPNDEDVKPATKEQRDLLFQKMKEAGYEWDAEKKELKKIEEYADWLKFLKADTWKPSDEQMNALSVAVKHGQTDDPDALKKLLEQLKKLSEE